VSPYGLALFSYAVFLIAWTFPPDVYTSYIQEPDLMFLDPMTFIFYTSCVAAFLFGVWACRYLGVSTKEVSLVRISTRMPLMYLAIPLLLATALGCAFLVVIGGKINFVALLLAQQAEEMKIVAQNGGFATGGFWYMSPTFLTACLWWSSYRARQINISGSSKTMLRGVFWVAFCVDAATGMARADRGSLLLPIAGLLIIYYYRKTRLESLRLTSLAATIGASIFGVMAIFTLLSFLRGASGLTLLMRSVLGYTITSYNRIPALLNGTMHYAYEGRGVYLSRFLLNNTTINEKLGLGSLLGWPTTSQLWYSEFASVAQAGLHQGFIWSGAFGYLYSDIGWWSLIYLLIAGIIAAYLWAGFKRGGSIAILAYLWWCNWILKWFGTNSLLDEEIVFLLIIGAMLALYDGVFTRKVREKSRWPSEARNGTETDKCFPQLQGVDNQ
jgi:hypothetical protein